MSNDDHAPKEVSVCLHNYLILFSFVTILLFIDVEEGLQALFFSSCHESLPWVALFPNDLLGMLLFQLCELSAGHWKETGGARLQ